MDARPAPASPSTSADGGPARGQALPGAFRLFEGAGHALLLTRAEAVNAALADFLAG